ncbi:MAG: hypothetical protein COW24_02315 [Candidatus Kerfeldbacteria bacterium CG15_BIG_FIL_POST_REV_8_21_14_020_45_12]|uniref:Ribulose-phosphate 3-epimerase n=1 Tax=Candidatus Kerfeldbacteria bacterium CG15_BIG_FIL_POST_REV_8_21_14_020_45_12 TaxID=2014247 RepID=A0A2M7H466_9BACT|nr:MAG: hypothetical protein COW24_02315 [Candidatus Kerfeldbacteria bacterium CG15_BIG_FIL_POST_REV_8_21_14_020_45_12]PJA93664.1 MAG: hypothetical protein CO132_02020 [Candidatus Kerfeldbacteria bacterium CG_4_9_14_3_um_filter_45_8]
MIQVVPAILEKTWDDVQDKVKQAKAFTDLVQLDVMDGIFVQNTTFNDTLKLATLDIDIELHLMIERPALHLQQWLMPNVSRVIFHYEADGNISHTIKQIRDAGKSPALAINPITSTYDIKEVLDELDMVLVMGVTPGFSGQSFQRDALEKIKELKKWKPELLIEVDGGVNGSTRNSIVTAGADILASASFIWNNEKPAAAVEFLKTGSWPS